MTLPGYISCDILYSTLYFDKVGVRLIDIAIFFLAARDKRRKRPRILTESAPFFGLVQCFRNLT